MLCGGLILALATYKAIVLTPPLDVTYRWGLVRCPAGFFFGIVIQQISMGGRIPGDTPRGSVN